MIEAMKGDDGGDDDSRLEEKRGSDERSDDRMR